nr:hypothetical protein [Tanacetum cinerariifolium]
MNPQETQQVDVRDEKWVPSAKRVKISSTNIRLETIMPQKKETFQVVIDIIKNSMCFKAFTISADILEIFMQQFWYTVKKVQDTDSYEFLLANKKCIVNPEVIRTILDICPRVEGVDFTDILDDDTTLTFLIDLSYKGSVNKHTNMLKFVRIGKDYQEYGFPIPDVMLTNAIKHLESYQMFIKYSTHQISPKKSRGKGSQWKKIADTHVEEVEVSKESKPKPSKKRTSSKRRFKKKVTTFSEDNIISDDPNTALELEEQEAADIMQALKESRKSSRRQPSTCHTSKISGYGSSGYFYFFIRISRECLGCTRGGVAAVASPAGVLELDIYSSVALRSSSPTTSIPEIPTAPILPAPSTIVAPSSEFPLAPIVAPPMIRRRLAIFIRPGEDIPIGRLYRTHPGRPCRALTARKLVRPLHSHRLSLRYTSHQSDNFTSGSSSSHSSSDHSSSGHSSSGHSLSKHTPPDTTDVDSSTPSRFVYPPPARTPRCSKAYLCWRSAPLSTMYPTMITELLAEDSSSESSVGPSRKRCRSPTVTLTSFIHATRALVHSRVDLLPPRKRFRDSISPDDSVEKNIDTNVLEDIEANATAVEVAVDKDVEAEVDTGFDMEIDVGVDVEYEVEDEVESSDRGTIEVGVDVVIGIDILDGMLMPDVVDHLEQNMTITRSGMTPKAIEELATRVANALEAENQSKNGSYGDNGNGGNRNGGNRNGENGNPNENNRDTRPVAQECTYQDFMKCQPLSFKGTEGVVGLKVNLTVKNNDLAAYTQRFQELTIMCTKMVPEEEDQVEKFIGGYAMKNAKNKRRLEVNRRDNHGQQPPFKRPDVRGHNVARAYTAGNNKKKQYNGPLPLCNKCKLRHEGPCTVICGKCNKIGYLTRVCKLKDQKRGNKGGNKNEIGEVRGKAYVLGGGDANPDSNIVKGTFLLNNHYAFVLFASGADRCFVSTTFSTLLDITPDALDVSYAVELADGRISKTNIVLRGYTLGLLGHPFNIDLMPLELGSFDVIIGMD